MLHFDADFSTADAVLTGNSAVVERSVEDKRCVP